jgi:hypothetical protein
VKVEKEKAKRVVEDEERDPRSHKRLLEAKKFGWKNEIRQRLFGQFDA